MSYSEEEYALLVCDGCLTAVLPGLREARDLLGAIESEHAAAIHEAVALVARAQVKMRAAREESFDA